MQLHIIRHGQAETSANDFTRKLSQTGIKQAEQIKQKIHLNNKASILSSSAIRAKQTAELIFDSRHIHYSEGLYLANTQELLKQLWSLKTMDDVILVGHNPGLSLLINYFTDEFVELSTGQYVCIDFGELSIQETSRSTGRIIK